MLDPVIVASWHTYDRVSIAQWINSGHHTCPKSGQRLIHMTLIPNYALKSLIHQFCQENNIPVTDGATSSSSLERSPSIKRKLPEKALDYISATKAAMDAVKMTTEFLVGKLAMEKSTKTHWTFLIDLLMDDKAGITDDSLAVLALLLGCSEGLEEIRKSKVLVPILIDLLRFGSPKGKENSITLLLGLCKDGGDEVARRLLMNPRSMPSLQSLAADGSMKAQRKADA